jgi:hypothetical protein
MRCTNPWRAEGRADVLGMANRRATLFATGTTLMRVAFDARVLDRPEQR